VGEGGIMSNSLNAQFRKEMEVELNTLRDRVMQLEPERRKEGLEILKRLRMILQLRAWMLDEIRHVCEEEDLDEEEKKTVLDCIATDLYEYEKVANSAELLRETILRCMGSKECGLCLRVLERLRRSDIESEEGEEP